MAVTSIKAIVAQQPSNMAAPEPPGAVAACRARWTAAYHAEQVIRPSRLPRLIEVSAAVGMPAGLIAVYTTQTHIAHARRQILTQI